MSPQSQPNQEIEGHKGGSICRSQIFHSDRKTKTECGAEVTGSKEGIGGLGTPTVGSDSENSE